MKGSAMLAVILCAASIINGQEQSLAGSWRFQLDPQSKGMSEKWFERQLRDEITLPGSCEQRGFGVKNTVRERDRLTRAITYEGLAWYQKTIHVPSSWTGKRLELFLERCHWESSVWLDGKRYDSQNSLSAAHVHDFGIVAPGRHQLTICIDNSYKLPIGRWGFAITDDTQGNWNGIIGRIELRATDPMWLKDVQVFPDHLHITVGNITGKEGRATLQNKYFDIPASGSVVDLPFKPPAMRWDEFTPALHSLQLSMRSGKYRDDKIVYYGIRDMATGKGQFLINGRPVLMRGPVNECIYPLTGYPPMDEPSWLHVFNICRSYGFNFMRFNSWCPPEAAFQAADRLGIYLQVELPFWSLDAPEYGQDSARDRFLKEELFRILEQYGNHPSFIFMAMGNESPGPLDLLVKAGRAMDTRRLYRCQNGDTVTNGDYAERGTEIGQRGIRGPSTDWDRWTLTSDSETNKYRHSTLPTLAHEVGQWSSYPDFDQIKKFTGTLRPYNYERFRQSLKEHGMFNLRKTFATESGKFALSLYKEEIEACLRTYPHGGFQIVEARDFPGEGTAIIGWLDAFWESKGLIRAEEFRRFCGPTVCLLRMPKRIFTSQEVFNGQVQIAHYGPGNIISPVSWKIENTKGRILYSGNFPKKLIRTGQVTNVGRISLGLKKIAHSARMVITVRGAQTSNSWNIWIYPMAADKPKARARIAYAFDEKTRNALDSGENVLLFSSPTQGLYDIKSAFMGPDETRQFAPVSKEKSAIPGSFMPAFWNMRLFNQIGTLSILCDPKHPALSGFPTEARSDWQWGDLLGRFTSLTSYKIAGDENKHDWGDVFNRSKSIILNETPDDYRPIVQMIDNYERNYKLGIIFETRVGKGNLLICALDLDTDSGQRPAARQLKNSLLNYVNSKQFHPSHTLPIDLLEKIL